MTYPEWLFGYGSIIWRPNFNYDQAQIAVLSGFKRRFWQASSDHRGTQLHPGAVATLRPCKQHQVIGIAYRMTRTEREQSLNALDQREQNGYQQQVVNIVIDNNQTTSALTYIAPRGNPWDLGHPSIKALAQRIRHARGPSGTNLEYFFELSQASRLLSEQDEHLIALNAAITAHLPLTKAESLGQGLQNLSELLPWHPLRRQTIELNT